MAGLKMTADVDGRYSARDSAERIPSAIRAAGLDPEKGLSQAKLGARPAVPCVVIRHRLDVERCGGSTWRT